MTDTIDIRQLKLEKMDLSLSCLRIIRPRQLDMMQESLQRLGQLNPVIVRKHESLFQVLDGFKRYYSAERLGWECLRFDPGYSHNPGQGHDAEL